MYYVHTGEAVVTSIKTDTFLLVTKRPIAHPGQFACIRNCVGEFGTDTGQPLVTINKMLNQLRYHHKVYYTYIEMYNAMCRMDTWQNFLISKKMNHFCYQKDCIISRSVSVYSYWIYDAIRAHRRGRGDKHKN